MELLFGLICRKRARSCQGAVVNQDFGQNVQNVVPNPKSIHTSSARSRFRIAQIASGGSPLSFALICRSRSAAVAKWFRHLIQFAERYQINALAGNFHRFYIPILNSFAMNRLMTEQTVDIVVNAAKFHTLTQALIVYAHSIRTIAREAC